MIADSTPFRSQRASTAQLSRITFAFLKRRLTRLSRNKDQRAVAKHSLSKIVKLGRVCRTKDTVCLLIWTRTMSSRILCNRQITKKAFFRKVGALRSGSRKKLWSRFKRLTYKLIKSRLTAIKTDEANSNSRLNSYSKSLRELLAIEIRCLLQVYSLLVVSNPAIVQFL